MAAELLGAKMLAPFFGSSLYVWATVLAITLGGLAIGYFVGGILSYKRKHPLLLFYVMLAAACFTMLMPFTSKGVLMLVGNHSLVPSIIISSLLFLFPPVFLMGTVSPIIIMKTTTRVESSGKEAGAVYAISTTGGILSTFLTGFYIIPSFGLTYPAIITGIILGIIPIAVLIFRNRLLGFLFISLTVLCISKASVSAPVSDIKILYNQEGLLGQVMVADYPDYDAQGKLSGYNRILYINRIAQSLIHLNSKNNKHFEYVDAILHVTESFPEKTKVLILGLGGGSLANEMLKRGFEVDVCELDQRIVNVARDYFSLSKQVQVISDDARHFIRFNKKKYDLVVFDVFLGEENPNHVFTTESMEETNAMLTDGGMLIVNGNGYLSGNIGKGMRSIAKTLIKSGNQLAVLPTEKEEAYRNLLFIANKSGMGIPAIENSIPLSSIDLEDAVTLTDDLPILDLLNLQANKAWRSGFIRSSLSEFSRRNIPLFD